MQFDFCIGNPPYQEEMETTSDKAVYNYFLDEAYRIADVTETINPARFLFNAGTTPKAWNEKMLNDKHLKLLQYEQISEKVFPNTMIKGGVAVLIRDKYKNYGEIGTFILFEELRSIKNKVQKDLVKGNLSDIMYQQNRFNLDALYSDMPSVRKYISNDGNEQRIISGYFESMNNLIFFDNEMPESIRVLGISSTNKRVYKWIKKKYVQDNKILHKYKVFVPFANGSGALGEVLSTPMIGLPMIGFSKSFIGIGCFDDEKEADSLLKYVKTKFVRTLLGILKTTQGNAPKTWIYVPLQDFTENSDIDWSKSIHDIDMQLYKKYNLGENEIRFIEEKVKPME